MKKISAVTLLLLSSALPPAAGAHDCMCRAKNVTAYEGQSVCLKTPQGWRLARCSKVLNNTAWVFLPTTCTGAGDTVT